MVVYTGSAHNKVPCSSRPSHYSGISSKNCPATSLQSRLAESRIKIISCVLDLPEGYIFHNRATMHHLRSYGRVGNTSLVSFR